MTQSFEQNSFVSFDGTSLSYEKIGAGPAVIVVPGALEETENFRGFAEELSHLFTVHTLDRRGHGKSDPQGEGYSINKECQDIRTLQDLTKAKYLFAHSFGGFAVLETARNNPELMGVAVYEPGISIDGSINVRWVDRCLTEIAAGKLHDAFTTFAQGVNPRSALMPRWIFKRVLRLALKPAELAQKYRLLATAIPEHLEEARLNNTYQNYQEINAPVLLMRGTGGVMSKPALAKLASAITNVKVTEFKGLDHFGPEQKPKIVANVVANFFAQAGRKFL
ncbi:MAG: alpha/beta hydrolase fold [Candidatus Doudnabacteria bacterium]|nr:alpha/beta hydrolase fold [Candidatus Doudnabacteria bacterium]